MTESERLRAALERIRVLVNTDCDGEDAISAMLNEIDSTADDALNPPPTTGRPPLTDRQAEVLEVIRRYRERNGYSPGVRELMGILGIASPNGVISHLKPLQKKGYLRRDEYVARSIVLVP